MAMLSIRQLAHSRLVRRFPYGITPWQAGHSLLHFSSSASCRHGVRSWTREEDEQLRESAACGATFEEMVPYFPGRTPSALEKRYLEKIVEREKISKVYWSEADDARLLELRAADSESWTKLAPSFPGRTPVSLQRRYCRLVGDEKSRTHVPWTGAEAAQLLKMKASGKTWKEIKAEFPERTETALYSYFCRIYKGPSTRVKPWSKEDDAKMLKLKAAGTSWDDTAAHWPNRTKGNVARRYAKIGPRGKHGRLIFGGNPGPLDHERDEIFRLHDKKGMRYQDIHREHFPHISKGAIKRLLVRRGIAVEKSSGKPWNRVDDKYLLRMRQQEHKEFQEIAQTLGRSMLATSNRYYKITDGTVRPSVPSPQAYTPAEHAKITQMSNAKASIEEMAAAIGRSKASVTHYLFANRDEFGYIRRPNMTSKQRRELSKEITKYRNQGFEWREVQAFMPEYSRGHLVTLYHRLQQEEATMAPGKQMAIHKIRVADMSESELQDFETKVTELKGSGLRWTEVAEEFPDWTWRQVQRLYQKTNAGRAALGQGSRSQKSWRPVSEIDIPKITRYRERGMTWKEIHAYMPGWSVTTLMRFYGKSVSSGSEKLQPLGINQVRKIARLRREKMTWQEVHQSMSGWPELQLRTAFHEAKKSKLI